MVIDALISPSLTLMSVLPGAAWRDTNDSAKRYTLTSLPGEFSGLHLVSLMYVGFRQIDPSIDGGIDLSKEHAEAEKLAMIM